MHLVCKMSGTKTTRAINDGTVLNPIYKKTRLKMMIGLDENTRKIGDETVLNPNVNDGTGLNPVNKKSRLKMNRLENDSIRIPCKFWLTLRNSDAIGQLAPRDKLRNWYKSIKTQMPLCSNRP